MAVFSAIAAAVVWAFTSTTVAAIVTRFVITAAASYLINRATMPRNQGSTIDERGVRLTLEPATNNHIPVVYGSAYIGGIVTDVQMLSTDNKSNNVMWYCLTFCENTGKIFSSNTGNASARTDSTIYFDEIYWNRNRITFQSDGHTIDYTTDQDGKVDESAKGLVKFYFFNNGSANPALPVANAVTGNTTPITGAVSGPAQQVWADGNGAWGVNHRMEGLAFALIRVEYNSDKSVTGLGEITVRTTNTLKKPGDVLFDYMNSLRYGAAIPESQIDTVSLDNLNTYSAETVTVDSINYQRYQLNGVVRTTEPVMNNMESLALCSGSYLTYDIGDGRWGVIINKTGNANLATSSFDSSNILGQITLAGTALDQLYNSVETRFSHREIRDQTDVRVFDLSTLANANLRLRNANEPDNRLQMALEFVNEPVQAEIIGKLELADSRNEAVITFNTDFSRLNTEAGDFIAVTSDVYGWTNKTFRVMRVVETEDDLGALVVQITAKEYTADVYDPGTLTRPPVTTTPGVVPITAIATPDAPEFTVINDVVQPVVTVIGKVPNSNAAITHLEFYATTDVNIADDAERTYYHIGTSNRNFIDPTSVTELGKPLAAGALITLTRQMEESSYYFKVRSANPFVRSALSGNSALLNWEPKPVTPPGTASPVGNTNVVISNGNTVTFNNYITSVIGCGNVDFGDFSGGCGIPGIGNGNVGPAPAPTPPPGGANSAVKIAVVTTVTVPTTRGMSSPAGLRLTDNATSLTPTNTSLLSSGAAVGGLAWGGAYDRTFGKLITVGGNHDKIAANTWWKAQYTLAGDYYFYDFVGTDGTLALNKDIAANPATDRYKIGVTLSSSKPKTLFGVATGGNVWLAVGAEGYGIRATTANIAAANTASAFGSAWANVTTGTSNLLVDITYGNGWFVACGAGDTVVRTNDGGNTWSAGTGATNSSGGYLNAIGYGNSTFMIATDQGIYKSTDNGATWSSSLSDASGIYNDIAYGGGYWVAVGSKTDYLFDEANLSWARTPIPDYFSPARLSYSSDNGATWTTVNAGSGGLPAALRGIWSVAYSDTFDRFYISAYPTRGTWENGINTLTPSTSIVGDLGSLTGNATNQIYYSATNNPASWTGITGGQLGGTIPAIIVPIE